MAENSCQRRATNSWRQPPYNPTIAYAERDKNTFYDGPWLWSSDWRSRDNGGGQAAKPETVNPEKPIIEPQPQAKITDRPSR